MISNIVSSALCLICLFLILFDEFVYDMNSAEIIGGLLTLNYRMALLGGCCFSVIHDRNSSCVLKYILVLSLFIQLLSR